jgi:hypothetical protein
MILVGIANVSNFVLVNNECKHDKVPLVMPESRGGGCFIVVEFDKEVLEEVVC